MGERIEELDDLVTHAVAGDRDSLDQLWRRHRRWVAAIILAHKPREADLEDLLQDVATTLVGKLADLNTERAFKAWLRSVAINKARTAGRRQSVRNGFLRLATDRAQRAPENQNDDTNNRLDDGRRLLSLAQELPEGYREPLLLKTVKGMSYRQIGEVLELPETTIETRIARGRRMLRERAQQAEQEQETARA